MPELPPKAFNKLSRTIGTGSAGPLGQARTPSFGEGNLASSPVAGPGYAELQVTSNFSFLRGASHPDELVMTAAALGHQAIAITDRNSVAGLVRAHQAAKSAGIRLVIGVRLDLGDGTSRLASVDGVELMKEQDRFRVVFGSGTTGVAETGWDTTALKNTFIVHEIRKIAVFVAKDAPKIDMKHQCIVTADGACSEDVPYATVDAAKGTRVYVDGKLAGVVKRKNVSDALAIGELEDGQKKLSVVKLAAVLGADTRGATSVELVK